MSIYMTAMSDLGEALTTCEHEAKVMSLNISSWDRISLTWKLVIGIDELFL